ncbi:MAG: diadenylate cyclase CdaA [Candidatus Gastranaerophilales bacterium]|nr:diadenylate cyclase CdaA [Candidatus Gastranaerophilales bacterium]
MEFNAITQYFTKFFAEHFKFNIVDIIELLTILIFVLFVYNQYIKGTHSEKLVKGLMVLIVVWGFSEVLVLIGLEILGFFLKAVVSIIVFSLVVVFQPELRKFLGYLGQTGFLKKEFFSIKKRDNNIKVLKEILEAIKYCSKTHCGALIVFGKQDNDFLVSDVGTKINADVSCQLILTIFHPNTPLHDGAMIIVDDKITAAGVLLPLTEDPKLSWKYGTRHRAAIGMSEASDCACLVVSEETGDVSIAIDGALKKYEDITELKDDLNRILGFDAKQNHGMSRISLFPFFSDKNGDK